MPESTGNRDASFEARIERLRRLLHLVRLGRTTAAELEELDTLLQSDERLQEHVVQELQDDALLRSELRVEAAAILFRQSEDSSELVKSTTTYDKREEDQTTLSNSTPKPGFAGWLASSAAVSASVVFSLGFVLALIVARYWSPLDGSVSSTTAGIDTPANRFEFVAFVNQEGGGLWDTQDAERVEAGSGLLVGDSVRLTDGIAQLDFSGGLTLKLEGPAEIKIRDDGLPAINYGRICVDGAWGDGDRRVATPLGTVHLRQSTSVGITVFGGEVQVHTFEGCIDFAVNPAQGDYAPLEVSAGTAWLIDITFNSGFRVIECQFNPEMFASQLSMGTNSLPIGNAYVEAVSASNPISYWRFEDEQGGVVQDVASGRHPLRLIGNPKIVRQKANHAIQFGYGSETGCLIADEPFSELQSGDYSIELWVKPDHFHNGALVGLIESDYADGTVNSGYLLQLTGPYLASESRNSALRFLHRSPAGVDGGSDSFSSSNYLPRSWQHVVTVREGTSHRLLLNGEVVAIGSHDKPLDPSLTLLVGQLYPSVSMRPFVGQLDELAIYDRALSDQEILTHFESIGK